jgi:hypothetical protein
MLTPTRLHNQASRTLANLGMTALVGLALTACGDSTSSGPSGNDQTRFRE